jgi:hypothetical protein
MEMMSLDDDLAAWAATVRLPDTDADAIFRRITGTSAPVHLVTPRVDPSWWRHFTAGYTARMVSSTRPVRLAA